MQAAQQTYIRGGNVGLCVEKEHCILKSSSRCNNCRLVLQALRNQICPWETWDFNLLFITRAWVSSGALDAWHLPSADFGVLNTNWHLQSTELILCNKWHPQLQIPNSSPDYIRGLFLELHFEVLWIEAKLICLLIS